MNRSEAERTRARQYAQSREAEQERRHRMGLPVDCDASDCQCARCLRDDGICCTIKTNVPCPMRSCPGFQLDERAKRLSK